jgi:CRP/FNR family transcriptional regulator
MAFPVSQLRKRGSRRKPRTGGAFAELTNGALEHFKNITRQVTYPGGSIVFREGQPVAEVYLLSEGQVKLIAKSAAGHTMIAKIARPGDVLGLSAMLNGLPHEVTAETLCTCIFKHIDGSVFLSFLQNYAEAGYLAALVLAKEHREIFLGARRLALSSSATARIAQILIGFADSEAPAASSPSFYLTLSHAELASLGGVSRETVTRFLNRLERDGVILRDDSNLTILQRSQLEEFAN